jgi:hypothetical protein
MRHCLVLGLSSIAIAAIGCAASKSRPARRRPPPADPDWESKCLTIRNDSVKVVLDPNHGGRVVEYSLNGRNALYTEDGRPYGIGSKGTMLAGRFDIGPERTTPRRPTLWKGKWEGRATGPRSVELTSAEDEATGVQLVRRFELAAASTHLRCTQTIVNVSKTTRRYYHWSRTFAPPGGLALVGLTPGSRFPRKYVQYLSSFVISFKPEDPHVQIRDGCAVIAPVPKHPKLGFDTYAGWMAYVSTDGLLFAKRFAAYRDRRYTDLAGITVCVYYHPSFCELEPIGPEEVLAPGASASFTEDWYLAPYRVPAEAAKLSCDEVRRLVMRLATG